MQKNKSGVGESKGWQVEEAVMSVLGLDASPLPCSNPTVISHWHLSVASWDHVKYTLGFKDLLQKIHVK